MVAAYDFQWIEEAVAAAKTYIEFKALATKGFDMKTEFTILQRFLSAMQKDGKHIQSFASRLHLPGRAAVGTHDGSKTEEKPKLGNELFDKNICTQFLNKLRDPVRRFTVFRYPNNTGVAVVAAVRE